MIVPLFVLHRTRGKSIRALLLLLGVPLSINASNRQPSRTGSTLLPIRRTWRRLRRLFVRHPHFATTEDYGAHEKMERSVDRIGDFGGADFAELATWLFASSLSNHRVVHQRIDEGSLLWRAVKLSGGPILEVGRAAGGSTLILLGASGSRPVISIDRWPAHSFISQQVFDRPDVAKRLKLYRQSSREPIAETEFGMMFVDADHSYEGVCHDIATFWNGLKSFDGKPPLAAFHDAADNPISYVEPVRLACQELVAEPGIARIVESWGSMLILEKTGNIDRERWYAKQDTAFWGRFVDGKHPVLKPRTFRNWLHNDRATLRLGSENLLGDENVEHDSWQKEGLIVETVSDFGSDNPLRLMRETRVAGEHGVAKTIRIERPALSFTAFLRPHNLDALRLGVTDPECRELAHADFELGNESRIVGAAALAGVEIVNAGYQYRNGYFWCSLAIRLPEPVPAARFAVNALGAGSKMSYLGNRNCGFFINLSSVREIV